MLTTAVSTAEEQGELLASLNRISFHHFDVSDREVVELVDGRFGLIDGLPVLYFADGRMWEEASMYLAQWAIALSEETGGSDLQSVQSAAWQLRAYLDYCEENSLDPMAFGARRYDKPTYLFRSRLIQQREGSAKRDDGVPLKKLAASTVSNRMGAVARFFLWVVDEGVYKLSNTPFKIKHMSVQIRNAQGISRSIRVRTTDLAIRFRPYARNSVEGGLRPVSLAVRDEILHAARQHCSVEFSLMLELGFRAGPRIQTICDLKCRTLTSARSCEDEHFALVKVGPKHDVATKGGVNYDVQLPRDLLERLSEYAASARRLLRVGLAEDADRDVLFLTRFGDRYNRRGADESTSVAQDMARLRRATEGKIDLSEFYFHCTRATFGTSIVYAGLKAGVPIDRIVSRLKTLMGHKDGKVSLEYVQFVENEESSAKINAELCA